MFERIKKRDQSIHINVSDKMVNTINRQVLEKHLKTDYLVNNEGKNKDQLQDELKLLLNLEL